MTDRILSTADGRIALATGKIPGEKRADEPKAKPVQHEREMTIALAEWLRLMRKIGRLKCRFTHLANERQGVIESILAYKMGQESGAPDLVFFLPNGRGAAIELKRPDGKGSLSREQKEWRDDLLALGWLWAQENDIEGVEARLIEWEVLAA